MTVGIRLAAYALLLALVGGAGLVAGAAFGPEPDEAPPTVDHPTDHGAGDEG